MGRNSMLPTRGRYSSPYFGDSFNSLFDFSPFSFFGKSYDKRPERELFENSLWRKMASDIRDEDNKSIITVDLPGVSKGDIKVDYTDDYITISGERKAEEKRPKYTERYCGTFSRSYHLPNVDATNIKASLKDGVLEIEAPYLKEFKSTSVNIEVK
jgi:HSP20 family molecular chaperone IbpA